MLIPFHTDIYFRSNLSQSQPTESLEFVSSDLSMILQLQKFYPHLTQVNIDYIIIYLMNKAMDFESVRQRTKQDNSSKITHDRSKKPFLSQMSENVRRIRIE